MSDKQPRYSADVSIKLTRGMETQLERAAERGNISMEKWAQGALTIALLKDASDHDELDFPKKATAAETARWKKR